MDLQALKTEITTDPAAIGYGAVQATAAWDNATADKLNAPLRQGEQATLTAGQLFEAIDAAEYTALTAANKALVNLVLGLAGDIKVGVGSNARTILLAVFGVGTTTRTRLAAAVGKQISRASELGFGVVTPSDVAEARRA